MRVLEQLSISFEPVAPRWRFSRFALQSPHHARIHERLEFVRGFFPELDGLTVRVGLVRKRGVLGWGSLDPERPGIWVRPRRLEAFTIAHEMTHLLQARGLVPRGERACDLWALARSPLLVDACPGYLRVPVELRRLRPLPPRVAALLHRAAHRAIEARERGVRGYLRAFERDVEVAGCGLAPPESAAARGNDAPRAPMLALVTLAARALRPPRRR